MEWGSRILSYIWGTDTEMTDAQIEQGGFLPPSKTSAERCYISAKSYPVATVPSGGCIENLLFTFIFQNQR
jgi:hypothetical protein